MTTAGITHYVFVDFENVPKIDLGLVAGRPVHVTLLIGKNQTKIDLDLVQQIRRLSDQIELVEVGASGRNALDLTLAFYLGQAVERTADAQFCIVSKDKDFEPMLAHLTAKGLQAVRCDSFAALPFLPKPKKHSPPKPTPAVKVGVPAKAVVVPAGAGNPDERFEKLVARLQRNTAPRPKRKSGLLAHISTAFGGRLPEAEQQRMADELIRRGVLTIDAKDRVAYGAVR